MNLDRLQQSGMTLEQVMQLMREGLNGSNGPSGPRGPSSSAVFNNLANLGIGGGLAGALAGGLPGASTSATAANVGGGTAAAGGTASSVPILPALAIAAAYGTGRGIHDAIKTWGEGGGRQQDALIEGGNAIAFPLYGARNAIGGPVGKFLNSDAFEIPMSLANPLTAPLKLADMAGVNFWSGKSREQRNRDSYRKILKDAGLIDENYQMNLPSGASLDWGKDGGAKLKNVGKIEGNPNSGADRFYYQTDLSNPDVMNNIGALNALGYIGGRGDKRLADNITGLASNTVGQGDVKQNSRELIDKFGGRNVVYGGVLDAFNKGYISEGQRDAALAGIDALWGIPNGAKPEEIRKIIEGRR